MKGNGRSKKWKQRVQKAVAMTLAITILTEIFFQNQAFALTGGPSQPEVQSFEPVGTSDMVDLFSGDFNYNIPLLDVEGYPINIAYHSGITMDQEASWVGLGWNINPGVINRSIRGIPDDFKGDPIVKEYHMKKNQTYGFNAGVSTEVFGSGVGNLGYTLGIHYNNYKGIGCEQSLSVSLSVGESGKGGMTGGLGLSITSSSDDGITVAPSISLSTQVGKNKNSETNLGLKIGSSFNARSGLKQLSVSPDLSVNAQGQFKGKEKSISQSLMTPMSASFNFGMPTYTPQVTTPMKNYSVTGNFRVGGELCGVAGYFSLGGYYSEQTIAMSSITNPAYGYMNSEEGQQLGDAILDFNRENDGDFMPSMPALPLTNFTYDIYSVSGQGAGGSYRPFRNDVGYVFDAHSSTTSDGLTIGGEFATGNLFHAGADFSTNDVNTYSGAWKSGNYAAAVLPFKATSSEDPSYEKFFFREANEKPIESDPAFYASIGGDEPMRFELQEVSKFNVVAKNHFANSNGNNLTIEQNQKTGREKRSQLISLLTKKEVMAGLGIDNLNPTSFVATNAPDYHVAEITSLGNDGKRYVYGLPAYNISQEEMTFAVGTDLYEQSNGRTGNTATGLVTYHSGDNSTSNAIGQDNYYSNVKTPAFAHSYFLTEVLSSDYIDADNTKGPSAGDFGTYTKFYYSKTTSSSQNYKWRTPIGSMEASYNEGLKSYRSDDRGSIIYGEKELWYLDSIETKNYVAVFEKINRADACAVNGRDGGLDASKSMKALKSISLYTKPDRKAKGSSAIPIKVVHFEYDYSLCKNTPNNNHQVINNDYGQNINTGFGKLTLKRIYFTYQSSGKAKFSPYDFGYDANNSDKNPNYNIKGYDRWGNYKRQPTGVSSDPLSNILTTPLSNGEFPYCQQDDKVVADLYASAWSLDTIYLPSSGKIVVNYESDEYAYVQDKQAMQMFKITAVEDNSSPGMANSSANLLSISDAVKSNRKIYFDVPHGAKIEDYIGGIDYMYFKVLAYFGNNNGHSAYDYVPGYAKIDHSNSGIVGSHGCISLEPVSLKDGGTSDISPIVKTAIQFARLHHSTFAFRSDYEHYSGNLSGDILLSLLKTFTQFSDFFTNPNEQVYDKDRGKEIVLNKSWIRLKNPSHRKFGGGSRVSKITMTDEWSSMTNSRMRSYDYGQVYNYNMADGSCSGVATYEPQIGGDENPFKQPVFFSQENLMAPDEKFFKEEPFGESFFPSPNVGYRRVEVKNIQRTNVTHHATGAVVHEFYTSYDYPTITKRTDLNEIQHKTNPFSLSSLFNINVRDYMTASQGFSVEVNDMNGKPKSQSVYQEGNSEPISSVEYFYKHDQYGSNHFRLNNEAEVIKPDGSSSTATIGRFYDMVADMREETSETNSSTLMVNLDAFLVGIFPIPVPMILPSSASERTQFRSATTTKIIQRFGILDSTVAKDLGSMVTTKNLAYDSETGEVLLTKTQNEYNDAEYNLTYPAHWYYNQMGPAYKNIGISISGVTFQSANGSATVANASSYFTPGDELSLYNSISNTFNKCWITDVSENSITAVYKDGSKVTGSNYSLKIIRSGRRNMMSIPIASITTMSDPRNTFQANIFENVIKASAMEYTDYWRTYCDCFIDPSTLAVATTNPYVLGAKGNWRLKKSYLHLTARSQSNYDNNTNIRKDGDFTSYTPFYKVNSGKFVLNPYNWTYTSEVTEFSPNGQELENKDALNRYSSATFGFNQFLPTSVAANARYHSIGFDSFEDYGFSPCGDNHFKFEPENVALDASNYHSGKHSIKVNSGNHAILTRQLATCDPASCRLTYSVTSIANGCLVGVQQGTAPYNFDWNVIQGDPAIFVNGNADGITITSTVTPLNYKVELITSDKNGCTVKQIFTQ